MIIKRSAVSGGYDVSSWGTGHRSPEGELISIQGKRGRWFMYFFGYWDMKRVSYCEKHRHDYVPIDFREGRFNISTILFTLKLKIKGEWNGL